MRRHRCEVIIEIFVKKTQEYFLRCPKKNTIGLILSNFIVFLEKPYFLKVRWFNSTSRKYNLVRFEFNHLLF
jgi:hypothetical protein